LPNITLKPDFFYADLYSVFSHRQGDRLHNLKFKKYQPKLLIHSQYFFKLVFLPGKNFDI